MESGVIDGGDLEEEILADPSGYYVNVHTAENSAGEIRGQIRSHNSVEEGETADDGAGNGGNGDGAGNGGDGGGAGNGGDGDGTGYSL